MGQNNEVCRLEIPARLDVKQLERYMTGARTTPKQLETLRELAENALEVARPVGIYKVAQSQVIDGRKTEIDGVIFTSKVLSKLLNGRNTVMPFIVTTGKELEALAPDGGDMMQQFYLDTIKTLIVANGVSYLREYLQKKYAVPRVALMNPGEIEDWHITEQKPLFSLFGSAPDEIGVTLTGGGVMKPIKSRSGIIFPNEDGFESCRLCTQLKCPGRRAEYNPELQKQYLA